MPRTTYCGRPVQISALFEGRQQTRKWSRRARRSVRSGHRGARLICTVGRTGKTRTRITRTTTKTHGCCSEQRGCCTPSALVRANEPPRTAARCGFSFGRRSRLVARAVDEAACSFGSLGYFDHRGVRSARRGALGRRRVRGAPTAPGGHGRCGRVCSGASAFGRSSQWRRQRAAWRVIRNVVASSHARVSSRDSFGQSGHPVGSRRTAGAFHGSPVGVRPQWRWSAPLDGSFDRRGTLGRLGGEGSVDRLVQHANGAVAPARVVRSCHRGARLICNVRRTVHDFL